MPYHDVLLVIEGIMFSLEVGRSAWNKPWTSREVVL